VPCVKVIYRVPAANIVCDWTLGLVTVIEPQPDGTIKHVTKQMLLDENDAAARYTMRRAWPHGEAPPAPTYVQRAEYPNIAAGAHVAGVVTVRLVVGPDGLVKSAVPLAGPAILQPPAVEAVRHWKFEPLAIGQQPTSFQLDEYFNYAAGKTDFSASMDPSGKVVEQETDSRLGIGFRSDGASSGNWQTCSATGCANAAPATPK
jgi:TonB family protein